MSEEKKEYSLCAKVPNEIAVKFESEVIKVCGHTYGNMCRCLMEAITDWIEKPKK